IATRADPRLPRFVMVRSGADLGRLGAELERERRVGSEMLTVVVEVPRDAETLGKALGVTPSQLAFFALDTRAISERAPRLDLEPAVGDGVWRAWASVERRVLAELRNTPVSDAFVDRSVDFKRRQQRGTPPIRRFVARDQGEPVGMIGFAPFEACDLGIAPPGRLARLRDVAVVPEARRRGLGGALVRAAIDAAVEELGATQVLIASSQASPAARLYRSLGGVEVGAFAQLTV
ncbi:MAG: GNAT family N-acetyltransferase, partial [Myxococcales bacterium]|nr:GNAT family N-acetyltransferase [Myxococcales bacterium]